MMCWLLGEFERLQEREIVASKAVLEAAGHHSISSSFFAPTNQELSSTMSSLALIGQRQKFIVIEKWGG